MAWYHGTFSCGHEGRVNVIGPHKLREWKIERAFEKMCPECYEKWLEAERKRKNQEAEENAKEMELPELQGTEKQIAWANTIRQQFIDKIDKLTEGDIKRYTPKDKNVTLEDAKVIECYILINKTKASYWIDNRNAQISQLISEKENAIKTDEKKMEEKLIEETKIESTVFPKNSITNVAAEILVTDNKITVMFEKNYKFRELVKSLGYSWNGSWEREITETTGSAKDRAAELGNKLLNEGFPVIILDEEIRENAIKGEYESECKRWIKLRETGEYKGRLVIRWKGQNDRLYSTARRLPGSRWDVGVVVRVEHYNEIEEFARMYEFKFTKGAKKAIEEYTKSIANVEKVKPVAVTEKKPKDGLKEILNSGSDILDDLKD